MLQFIHPILHTTNERYVNINGVVIKICSNTEDLVKYCVSEDQYIDSKSVLVNQVTYSIILLKTESISAQYSFFSEDNRDKLSAVCTPNLCYEFDDISIKLFKYPNNSVHFELFDKNSVLVLAENTDVLLFYLKDYIKRVVIKLLGKPFLHASAVSKRNAAVAFIGDGNAGKSTISYNLTKLGWTMLNDDILFADYRDNEWYVEGIQINPCLRKAALPYVIEGAEIEKTETAYFNDYHRCYYLTEMFLQRGITPLKCVFWLDNSNNRPADSLESITKSELLVIGGHDLLIEMHEKVPIYHISKSYPVEKLNQFANSFIC